MGFRAGIQPGRHAGVSTPKKSGYAGAARVAVKTGVITDPMIGRVALARTVNLTCGAPIVTPWTVDQVPDEYLDAVMAYAEAMGGN